MGHAKLAVLISRNWYGGGRCRFGGSLVPLAPLPLTTARVGAGTLVVFGDYQIAPIAARSTAMGRWRLTPPWYWGDTACGRKLGRFVPPARVPFFFCKKKGTKENHLDLRSKNPLARGGSPPRRRVGFPLAGRRPPAATFLSAKKEMWERKSLRPTV